MSDEWKDVKVLTITRREKETEDGETVAAIHSDIPDTSMSELAIMLASTLRNHITAYENEPEFNPWELAFIATTVISGHLDIFLIKTYPETTMYKQSESET